ncbi:MAG: alcohol dehydrogenase catalytic domain-containing protein, partial [Christensenellaceae bacterium]
MKAFAMLKIGEVGFIEKPEPKVDPMGAIIRPIALAPCTSDIHTVYSGAIGERENLILGHESVGIVEEVGELVRDFKPGDRVVVSAITPDWGSREAQQGFPMHSGGTLAGWKFSNHKDGVFAEKYHVNEADANLALLPPDIPPETAVMLCDMVTTGFHGAELAEIGFGDSVCVIGIGPVGLMSVRGAYLRGAGRIIAVGSRANCVRMAKEYGATDVANYKKG